MVPIGRDSVHLSHSRLGHTLSSLTDADARRPSLLPGWTVGHLLTHLARNADSFVRILQGGARGEVADQYAGGTEQRDADIEAGSGRAAADLVADVAAAAARFETAWAATPDEVMGTGEGRVEGSVFPLSEVPFRRWREVEIHHVDLDLGYGVADWPEAYVDLELAVSIAGLAPRLAPGTAVALEATDTGERWVVPEGSADARPVRAERRRLLAWLVGRAGEPAFPQLGHWEWG